MTEEKYLELILIEIEALKKANKKGLYKMNAKIPDRFAKYIYTYFSQRNDKYDIEIKKCAVCKGTWDILITFKGS